MKERSWPSSPPCRAEALAKADLWPTAPFFKTQKLPNEPNLKTAPPAIPAGCEEQPDEIYKGIIFNTLGITKKPVAASEISLKQQKIRSKIMQNACKKHVKKRSF